MKTHQNILIIGYGSIGKRHFENLKSLGYSNLTVYDPEAFKTAGLNVLPELDPKKLKEFNAAIICSPTNLHLEHATICAKSGLAFFVEKPLLNNLAGLDELEQMVREKSLVTMVGCNMRFHPCLRFIKTYLESKKLGRVYSINNEFGYYLPEWRKGDYRENYAARPETGGGVLLDDIHEYDLMFWLNDFSSVTDHKVIKSKSSALELETEDQASGSFLFENGVIGRVFSDYLSRAYRRTCLVIGEQGNLSWDWNTNVVVLASAKGHKVVFKADNFNSNHMYVAELEHFFASLQSGLQTQNDISQASILMKLLLKKNG
ncbi:MAG: Gfo/Idh/MocA family oxidoreductase [Candidatus Taylorbacteria bacterium]|nr:Gfo/Idh/MocA family oxidoreductase [Candidatus Taylorbacteria bacterium]